MADAQKLEETLSEAVPKNESQKKQETRDEILSRHRHRKEIAQLQNKEIELKKAAARGSKAEQKAKKKLVEEEVSQLSSQLKEKHAEELASLGYSNNSNGKENNLDTLVRAIDGVSVTSQAEYSKPSKSTKWQEKRAQQEAAREQRIQEEQNNIVSDRFIEYEKLQKKPAPLGLTVNEIKPDGHCLYRAVEDQLARFSGENVGGEDSDASLTKRFEDYCNEMESTAVWGGQLELGALAHYLKKHILVFSGSFPDVEMRKEYKSDGESVPSNASIMLSYHKHAFGLGEHLTLLYQI